jgi:hypothetical protein
VAVVCDGVQADEEAVQIAEACGSNGASVCGSQANDKQDTAAANRGDTSRLDRATATGAKSRPGAVLEQDLSVKVSTGASFCEEMRNRARRMQQEMRKREDSIASLHLQIQSLQDKHGYRSLQIISARHLQNFSMNRLKRLQVRLNVCSDVILRLEQQHSEALASHKAEADAALQRHLDLIDRLLSDKDVLTRQIDSMQEQHSAESAKHEDTMKAMKAGWAQELRQQKEAWSAAEKVCLQRGSMAHGT